MRPRDRPVRLLADNPVAIITFNRPEVVNTISDDLDPAVLSTIVHSSAQNSPDL